ncbi:MAG: biotin/lipoyl-binding protein, partial [Proteobacteria bacterium]|nr:biotin/lipoyl-binding protein [Pseudomonadota bacterium]
MNPPPQLHPEVARDASVAAPDAAPIRLIGVLTAAESVDIAPRVAGVILKVNVAAGDPIVAGQVIVEMDPMQLQEELRAAEAALGA